MAVRQTSAPAGAALAALVLPPVAAGPGVPAAFGVLAATCLVTAGAGRLGAGTAAGDAGAVGRGPAGPGPRRPRRRRLLRLSLAGALLVVPQFLGSVFLVEVLHTGHGTSLAAAGRCWRSPRCSASSGGSATASGRTGR